MSYGVGLRNGVAFALGTIPSLTSGGGLRPSLLLNFLSGSLDSRITFSRGTQATQYTSNGTLQYAPNNLLTYSNQADNAAWTKSNSFVQTNVLLYSEQFDNAAWTKSVVTVTANAAAAPDGTSTADLVVPTAADCNIRQAFAPAAATNYTFSVWLRSATGSSFDTTLRLSRTSPFSSVSSAVITVTNTWTRYTLTAATLDTTTHEFWIGGGSTLSTGEDFYAWGAQVVQGSVPGDYRATTSAALPVLYADYQGNLRARKLCEDAATAAHNFNQATGVIGNTETLSFYAKAGERTWAISQLGSSSVAYFDLQNGVLGNVSAGTATITLISNGYYRCTLTGVRAGNASSYIYCTTGNGVASYAGNGSSGIYIADAQLEAGSVVQAYNDTTSAAYYGPRFDYEPVTKVLRGLLIEEQRVNLATFSNTFSDASWTAAGTKNVAASAILSPEGIANAWTLTDSSAVAFDGIQKAVTVAADGTTYTGSVYILKTSGGTSSTFGINFAITGGTTVTTQPRINTDTGAVISGAATVTNAGLWWRVSCSVTNNSSVGNTNLSISLYPATSAYNTVGDNVAATGSATIYGAQVETGAFATSYIPTVGSQVTRSGDNVSMATITPWFNQTSGTIYAQADTLEPAILGARSIVAINDGTASNFQRLVSYNGKIGGGTNTAGVLVADLQPFTYTVNTPFKFAYAYATNDFAAVGNGGTPLTDNLGALPTGLNTMGIGLLSGVFWCGHIQSISYYPTRLPNATLQGLTV